MTRELLPTGHLEMTPHGLIQREDTVGHAALTVESIDGQVAVLGVQRNGQSALVRICPDHAQHFMERLRVAIDLARYPQAEAIDTPPARLSADGDRMLVRPAQAEQAAA